MIYNNNDTILTITELLCTDIKHILENTLVRNASLVITDNNGKLFVTVNSEEIKEILKYIDFLPV